MNEQILVTNFKPKSCQFEPYVDNGGSSLAIAAPDFCVLASDTRQSNGYNINTRFSPKTFKLTETAVLAVNGYHADGLKLSKDILSDIRMYQLQNGKTMPIQSIAQLVMTKLYSHRFFPYYTFTLLGGVDEKGEGAVYSFDPVGSFDREKYRAAGSAAPLMQPLLDNQIGNLNRIIKPHDRISLQDAVKITKDAFNAAAERDIHTGDNLQIWVISKNGCELEIYPLRKD